MKWTQVVTILRELRPDNKKIPDPPPNEGDDLSVIKPREDAENLLKRFYGVTGWTNLRDSLADGIADI